MKNVKHSYFSDIRRMFLLYAIIPVLFLTFICLIIFSGSWRYSLEKTNKQENGKIASDLEVTIYSYIEVLEDLANQKGLVEGKLTTNQRVKIFEDIYGIANRLDRKANLYVFDEELTPVVKATKTVPSYLNGEYYSNWGIFYIMNKDQESVAIKIVEEENSGDMELLIGKAVSIDGHIKGYIIFAIDSNEFKQLIETQESQTIIADEYGWVYVSNNYSFLDKMSRVNLSGQKLNRYVENITGKYYITESKILDGHINIYSISSLNSQNTMFLYIFVILIGVFAMLIIMVNFSTKKMAEKKTKSLYTIIKALDKAKEGNLDTYIKIESDDEFGIIAESYNVMLDSFKGQIERNKEMGQLVAASQTKQLELQFNTHFLYNTLENIRFMCKLNPNSASEMIFNLSTLLRYSINNKCEEVTVKEDVLYTENYISILKYRFNQRFNYSIQIPEEVERCIIPKLILQPMIENAIMYGLEGRDKIYVEIIGRISDGQLVLACSDDGTGIPKETLLEINRILSSDNNKSNHSGLYNIHRRVQLKYGEGYGVHIKSEYGVGTLIEVNLPVKYE